MTMLPRVHFIETTMMRTLKPILANSKTLLKYMLMKITNVDELTLLLQKTASSQVKSRLALGSPGCLFFWCHHAGNGWIHRKIAVDCALMITSKGAVNPFCRPGQPSLLHSWHCWVLFLSDIIADSAQAEYCLTFNCVCVSVCVYMRGISISHIYNIPCESSRDPSNPIYSESKSSWLSF